MKNTKSSNVALTGMAGPWCDRPRHGETGFVSQNLAGPIGGAYPWLWEKIALSDHLINLPGWHAFLPLFYFGRPGRDTLTEMMTIELVEIGAR
jgi:hypothetical protein